MGVVTRAKMRRLQEEQELVLDHISVLPDGVLGDIVSLLPTKDGARTQLLSSRWRHLWRAAPLNLDFNVGICIYNDYQTTSVAGMSGILSSHPGPGRRFAIQSNRWVVAMAELDGWLRCPSLNNLEELKIHFIHYRQRRRWTPPPPPLLPASALRFSSTLAAASFDYCTFPDCGSNDAIAMPLLKRLTLLHVTISEASLQALLAGCHVLETLLLLNNKGYPRLKIASNSLRSIGAGENLKSIASNSRREGDLRLQQIVIEDAPCLERLLFAKCAIAIDISIVSAPRLSVLGELIGDNYIIRFGTTALQVARGISLKSVVHSVRVLALSYVKPDEIINLMRCFPHLEKLYIQRIPVGEKNESHDKYWKLAGTIDIRLRKVVLPYCEDYKATINFAKFFVRNARLLESMTLELQLGNVGKNAWIIRQQFGEAFTIQRPREGACLRCLSVKEEIG
ncbi:unnamed protein product [Urochloa decumbens]|uniref:F-box domain-containing protein n=1 Tax=Urochloa decumbens TaxID=240449 RepID=A0ABC9FLJ3_9POAL